MAASDAALKDLLFRLADDKLIHGHRMSEWTGFGPVLEEDIAFASMAQDALGHAESYYRLLHGMGEGDPDQTAFGRQPETFRCCQFVELPIGDYAFSLMRHFLFDMAESVRLEALTSSSHLDLKELAKRISREAKYHQLHAKTFIKQLGGATEESHERMKAALAEAWPMAFSIFEPTPYDDELADTGVFAREEELEARWVERVQPILNEGGLEIPDAAHKTAYYGGREGRHTEHLGPLLTEMTEVFRIDPAAIW